jgi:hypothetical protein
MQTMPVLIAGAGLAGPPATSLTRLERALRTILDRDGR